MCRQPVESLKLTAQRTHRSLAYVHLEDLQQQIARSFPLVLLHANAFEVEGFRHELRLGIIHLEKLWEKTFLIVVIHIVIYWRTDGGKGGPESDRDPEVHRLVLVLNLLMFFLRAWEESFRGPDPRWTAFNKITFSITLCRSLTHHCTTTSSQ
jgi:hypothetical protein